MLKANEQPQIIQNLEPVKQSDLVNVWIGRLNTLIEINKVVASDLNQNFGYILREDQRFLDELKNNISFENSDSSVKPNIMAQLVDTTNFKTLSTKKKLTVKTIGFDSTINLNHDSDDAQEIVSSKNIVISLNPGTGETDETGRKIYSEKILSINAAENIEIKYNCQQDSTFRFVNNGLQPNIKKNTIVSRSSDDTTNSIELQIESNTGTTVLRKGHTLVMKFIFFGNKTIINVMDNTQLVANYNDDIYSE